MRICTTAHLRERVSSLLSRWGAGQRLSDSRHAASRQADKEAAGSSAGGDRKKEANEVNKDQRKDDRSSSKADDDRLLALFWLPGASAGFSISDLGLRQGERRPGGSG